MCRGPLYTICASQWAENGLQNLLYNGESLTSWKQAEKETKGLYPHSHGSLEIVDIDASKGFVYLWVQLSFAIFAIFDLKRLLKLLEMACDQIQTCFIFPLQWACFPTKIGRNAHRYSMWVRPCSWTW